METPKTWNFCPSSSWSASSSISKASLLTLRPGFGSLSPYPALSNASRRGEVLGAIKCMHCDDLVLGLVSLHTVFPVCEVPPIPELDPGRCHRRSTYRAATFCMWWPENGLEGQTKQHHWKNDEQSWSHSSQIQCFRCQLWRFMRGGGKAAMWAALLLHSTGSVGASLHGRDPLALAAFFVCLHYSGLLLTVNKYSVN